MFDYHELQTIKRTARTVRCSASDLSLLSNAFHVAERYDCGGAIQEAMQLAAQRTQDNLNELNNTLRPRK